MFKHRLIFISNLKYQRLSQSFLSSEAVMCFNFFLAYNIIRGLNLIKTWPSELFFFFVSGQKFCFQCFSPKSKCRGLKVTLNAFPSIKSSCLHPCLRSHTFLSGILLFCCNFSRHWQTRRPETTKLQTLLLLSHTV